MKEVITYKSSSKNVTRSFSELDRSETKGLICEFSGCVNNTYGPIKLSWRFNWEELETDYEGLSGIIIVKPAPGYSSFQEMRIDVDLTESDQTIERLIQSGNGNTSYQVTFEYSFVPHFCPIQEISYDEMFLPCDKNDSILVVEGKKLHVSKTFLSYHSEYFRALFSSNYKEGQMDQIPIKDISFKDFGLLLSSFYPETEFPNDKTVEKLLELADRFIIPSVIRIVEYHLLHNTRIGNEKLMWLADKYGMAKLLNKSIRQMNSIEKAKKMKASPEYNKLSNDAKASILDKLMTLI